MFTLYIRKTIKHKSQRHLDILHFLAIILLPLLLLTIVFVVDRDLIRFKTSIDIFFYLLAPFFKSN